MQDTDIGLENTTPETEEQAVNEANETNDGAPMEQNAESNAEKSAQSANATENQTAGANEPFLEIRYNHERKGLSKEEAVALAQKGMHYEGAYKTLERVAALKGQSVKEFLGGIEAQQDEAYRQELLQKFGENEEIINKMMELYQIEKQKTLDEAALRREEERNREEQSVNERLANEFTEMLGEFEGLTDFASLPNEVKEAAMEGMSLSHAYLKYLHRENKKIAAEKQAQEAAAKKSTGSMASEGDTVSPVTSALLSGLWN